MPKNSSSFLEAVNVVTAGIVEDQPSPMHTKEFQTLSVNLDGHEIITTDQGINIDESIIIQYVDVPTDIQDIQTIIEVSCGTSCFVFHIFSMSFFKAVLQLACQHSLSNFVVHTHTNFSMLF